MSGALIVTAELGEADHARLTALRTRYFPPDRNHLDAHLTLFHALPPSAEEEVAAELKRLAAGARPAAMLDAPYSLGRGVAFRVRSPELERLRDDLAERFHGVLTAQDRQGWRPHVTVQNKVEPAVARATLAQLSGQFRAAPLTIAGLGLYRYLGGPWGGIGRYAFRG